MMRRPRGAAESSWADREYGVDSRRALVPEAGRCGFGRTQGGTGTLSERGEGGAGDGEGDGKGESEGESGCEVADDSMGVWSSEGSAGIFDVWLFFFCSSFFVSFRI